MLPRRINLVYIAKTSTFYFSMNHFVNLPPKNILRLLKTLTCVNCLKSGQHQAKNYTASSCRKCGKSHNSLHFETAKADDSKHKSQAVVNSSNPANALSTGFLLPVATQCSQISNASKIFLSTAIIVIHVNYGVDVYDYKGELHGYRILLDSGFQLNFVTEHFLNKVRLDSRELHMSISGIAKGTFETKKIVEITFRLGVNAYIGKIECIVLPKITQNLPQEFSSVSEFKIPSNIILADPNFNIPNEINMFIGAQLFWQLICVGQIKACTVHPTLQKTKLGWIISAAACNSSDQATTAVCHVTAIDKLNKAIFKFWEIEHNIPLGSPSRYTPNERACEEHF
ncbi:uncharacterized protein LOC118646514 [Monomorium pharaonis]|uniref:uncharacterized protein LOC118646514 n=1 Tax=Monomorium pharaonis TaxID=307658 RepID=UPI001746426B|nr:uncharacterized protein LOC118646514 [Monomorium pharaonis]